MEYSKRVVVECPHCNGSGHMDVQTLHFEETGKDLILKNVPCILCKGEGKYTVITIEDANES